MEISDKFKEIMENDSDDDGSEQEPEEFICCVCRDLLYKPVVLACGHISCFWCIHKSMSGLHKSHCPLCRNRYYHFPSICQTLHLLLLKMYPVAYNKREKQVLEDETAMGCFSPQFYLSANQLQPEETIVQPTGTLQSCISEADFSLNPRSIRTHETLKTIEQVETGSVHLEIGVSNLQIHGEDIVTTGVSTVEDKNSSPIYPSGTWKQVSAGDVLCGACMCVFFRPVVLNCGHVFCVSCIVLQTNEMLKCEVCQSPHPGGIPKVCLEFDHFLEKHFPREYGLRRGFQMKQEELPSETPSACSSEADKKSSCFPKSSGEDHLQWWNASSKVHPGFGCDSCGLGPVGDKTHVSSRVMGTYGYCAPEYQRTGHLTAKSDVYSYGVVLLKLITGKRAIDTTRRREEQNLVTWAEPIFKEPSRFSELADPFLGGDFPKKSFNQAIAVSAMCLQEDAAVRPFMSDVVTALSYLWEGPETESASPPVSIPSPHSTGNSDKSEIKAMEREKEVAEAIAWGSRSRNSAF